MRFAVSAGVLGSWPARRAAYVIALAIAHCNVAQAQSTNKPNIVVILSDDAGYNEFGFNAELTGSTTPFQTPNLDALAEQSIVARQGYTSHSLCSPSRAGLLTGQYQQRFGFESNTLGGSQGFTANEVTMATHLKNLGYSTGMVGKWHTGNIEGVNLPTDKGFDEFFGFWGGARHYFHDTRPQNMIRRGNAPYESEYRAGGNPAEYDPAQGRYVTDAFGDEAAAFIANRANQANPFFLYMAPNAPHDPYEAKTQDLNHFAHIPDTLKRKQAAMTYALDRAVGKVLHALDDPNGDGNTDDSVRENTIIVFTNDNGGTPSNDNTPFRGTKGFAWEGSIRVPFIIDLPGTATGVYDHPITARDVLPTVYAAAGGDVSELDADGVDLFPYLSGGISDRPHEALFWRNQALWAVRKGDWKYATPDGFHIRALFNLADDPGETTDVSAQNPEVVADLLRELTYWEASLAKPRWHDSAPYNTFDHFVFRADSFSNGLFTTPDFWKNAATGASATLRRGDGYANAILEFPTKSGSYNLANNQYRLSGQTFMVNELRLTGNFTGSSAATGLIGGIPLLLVQNLEGGLPTIRLDSTSSGTPQRFRFDLNTPLEILHDLEITGDGTQQFFINGAISELDLPRNVTKSGTSHVTLGGNNTFRGHFTVSEGKATISGPNAAIRGASSVIIGSSGTLAMDGGLMETPLVDRSAGGAFSFTGGELRTSTVLGDLTNQGGNFSPNSPIGANTITGDFTQSAGKLTIELGGTQPGAGFDQVAVGGHAQLGGSLQVNLTNDFVPEPGHSFDLIVAEGGIAGQFADTVLPILGGGWSWQLIYDAAAVQLVAHLTPNPLPGDYDYNHVVDAADYVFWRKAFGGSNNLAADGDGDGLVDQGDYHVWRANFGKRLANNGDGAVAAVPEPMSSIMVAVACLLGTSFIARRPRSGPRSRR